jgi:G3E family GTPase
MTEVAKIPVTVLTGFLGSGKTTLLNHILTAAHGQRIAVIENEFGEIPVDDALVLSGDEEIFEMTNGCCLCCTARTDLVRMIRTLLARADRFDRIVIETTGLADPNPVAQTFFVEPDIAEQVDLDAIVTLVDAKHIGGHLDEVHHDGVGDQAVDQIAFADRLIVNKVDLVTDAELDVLETRLRGINASADIIRSHYAAIDLDEILGVGAFDMSRTMAVDPGWLDDDAHVHDIALTSVGLETDRDLDPDRLGRWIAQLVGERGDDLYRMKGILALAGDGRRSILQGIHHTYEMRAAHFWGRDARRSKLVFIGRDLDRAVLSEGLQSCLAA